jgi:hypothetical protein
MSTVIYSIGTVTACDPIAKVMVRQIGKDGHMPSRSSSYYFKSKEEWESFFKIWRKLESPWYMKLKITKKSRTWSLP